MKRSLIGADEGPKVLINAPKNMQVSIRIPSKSALARELLFQPIPTTEEVMLLLFGGDSPVQRFPCTPVPYVVFVQRISYLRRKLSSGC